MGTCIRHLLVDQNDEVFRLSNRSFEKLWEKSSGGVFPQFAGRRVRWAEAVAKMQNRQPVVILRVVYCYLHFDGKGRLDRNRVMKDGALMMEAGIGSIFLNRSVIDASSRFAARRRDHEAVWKPSWKIKEAIYDAALGSKKFTRL